MIRRFSFILAIIQPLAAQIPAFPGAEGYGAYAIGGRGGDVYVVTNLNASGAGSFRNGIETVPAAGRTIVFAVSGHIHINGLRLTSSKVTIAGQTAPGDGVGLIDGTFRISGDDVVVRHLRIRHRKSGSGGDCINLDSGSINSVLDSISMQFSTDENFSSFGSPPENLTMQWSLNAWGLESHSCGGLWDQNHATCHHSLWAHNHTRNPKARPNGLLEWTNNVTFDWDIGFIMGDSETPAAWKANVRNSYFLCPPGNLRSKALEKANLDRNGNPNFSLYLNNCRHDNDGDGILNGIDKGYSIASGSYVTLAAPVPNTGAIPVTMDDPVVAFKKIVSKSGALRLNVDPAQPLRDEVDTRLIQNLVTQTKNHITSEANLAGISNGGIGTLNSTAAPLDADRDGMPDYYELSLGWNPAGQDHNTALANSGGLLTGTTFMPMGSVAGYTRLEEYLHLLAIPHGTVAKNIAGSPTSVQVDLKKFTAGFSSSPVFTVSNIIGGTIVQSGVGNSIATFTPTLDFVGRARFDFTVTDSAGHAWTQTCGLLVTNAGLPRDLEWQGGLNTNAWDSSTHNWLRSGAATSFSFGDRVSFDDGGSKTPALNVTGTVNPGSVDFDAAGNYTVGGSGAVTSSGPLTKRGTGTVTISNTGPNAFSSATLDSGALTIGSNTALGSAPLTINGGTLNIGSFAPTASTLTIAGPTTITGGNGGGATGIGPVNGSAPLTINQTNVFDLRGDMTGYQGIVSFIGNSVIRLNGALGSALASFDLGAGTTTLSKRSSATVPIPLGSLSGGANTSLQGATGTGNTSATTYVIGHNGNSTTFAGDIANGGGTTTICKVGSGSLTLSGAGSYTGATHVGGVVVAVTVTNGGSGFTSAPTVVFTGGGGTGATATAAVSSGKVTQVSMTNSGSGYTSAPVVSFTGGAGTGALATASVPSGGALLVAGSLETTAVNVAGGSLLGGEGLIGGPVTAKTGAILSPGTPPFTGATLTLGGGLALNGNTLYYDMSDSPVGANDRIAMNGTLAMTGTQYFQFLLLQGRLNAGTYDLITGATTSTASGVSLTHNLPVDSRQTFGVYRSAAGSNPSKVWLTVTGNPATLIWTGATNTNWDTATAGNWSGGTPNTFYNHDDVVLNDTASNRLVNVEGTVTPRTITLNHALGYTLGGSGVIGGEGSLVKNGNGTLTFAGTNANTFTGGLTLNGGTINFANDDASNAALGAGPVTLNGGTLSMFSNFNSYDNFTAALVVSSGVTATINADSRVDVYGSLSGGGTLNFSIPSNRTSLFANWSAFSGQLNATTGGGYAELRMSQDYNPSGFPNASVNLGNNVIAVFTGNVNRGAGTTIAFGALAGTATSRLLGGPDWAGSRLVTYRIGGCGIDTQFAGGIAEQNPAVTNTSIVKTGAGVLTLGGTSNYNGGTTIEQGTLRISGTVVCASATNVQSEATLELSGGSLSTESLVVAGGASLIGHGALTSDLNTAGLLQGRGFATGTPGTLAINGSIFLGDASLTRLRGGISSDLVTVSGDVSLGGTLQVGLSPGTTFGRYPLMTYGGALTGVVDLTGIAAGTTAKLSTTIAGRLDLVIDDNDEDGLPDSWEVSNFGNLGQTAAGDKDGDGSGNLVEYRLNLNPSSGTSAFRASCSGHTISWPSAQGVSFTVKRSVTLGSGEWQTLGTVVGGAGSTASYTDPAIFEQAFYRIEFTP